MKIRVRVSLGLVGCTKQHDFEIDDDQTDDDIEEIAREEMFNMIEWGWDKIPAKAET